MTKRVAVVGLAFRFPGTTTQEYWSDLLRGCDLITEVDPQRWSVDAYVHPDKKHPGTAYTKAAGSIGDVSGFDADFFGISPREAALLDPQQRVLLELCWEAMESAAIKPAALRGSDCGVYVGIASTDYAYRIAEDLDAVDASMATGNAPSIAANRLSYFYDLRGPSIAMDTACSSSMVAFHQACQAITSGECSQALAGGISLHLHPYGFIGFSKATMLSRQGRCRVFDAAADGYVRSEGGGLFLLKDYDRALADGNPILAVVARTVVNTDGRKSGLTIPSADAQIALMRQAYASAGIAPQSIDYLEAHGTGTPVGDPIETYAIGVALGQPRGAGNPLPIGSVKTNMGHLETASGVAGLVKAIYALRHRIVPASIGVENLNPNIKADDWNIEIVTDNRPLRATGQLVIGVNSFGFGGANAHVILQSPPEIDAAPRVAPSPGVALPLVLTGKSVAALEDYAVRLADALSALDWPAFYDAAYHMARSRQWHAQRAVVFAANGGQARDRLRAFAAGDVPAHLLAAGSAVPDASGPVFAYSGNGSQWAGMGRRLLEDPVFADTIAEIDGIFQKFADWSLADELAGKNGDRYAYTEIAQPALFALQVGVTRMLARRGIKPVAVMGHSVGEVAAAWACNALSLPDAVQVIFQRSRLQGLTKGSGQMTAVGLGGEETLTLLETLGLRPRLSVAGINSASGATVAGDAGALDVLETHLAERQIFCLRLGLDYAFHSPAMDPIEDELRQVLAGITPRSSDIPFYSTVTGTVLDGSQLDGAYWWRNIRMPVQFASAGEAAIADGHGVFVEVGAHTVLRFYLNDLLKCADRSGRVVATVSRNGDEPERIAAAAGQVMLSGAPVDWDVFFAQPGRHIDLPGYAWQRERHWHPVSPESAGLLMREAKHPLLGYALRQHESTWQNQLDTQSHPVLADHVVGDAVVFPGAGYAELALAVAQQWQPGAYAEFEELEIRAPLLLAASPAKIVRVVLDRRDGRVHIQAKEQGADAAWTLQATSRLLQEAGPALLNRPALALPQTTPDFTAADHHTLTRLVGLHYGPAFCAIAHGWRESSDSVLAAFAPHERVVQELPHSHLHPVLLDCAFQLTFYLLKDDPAMRPGIAFVPVKIGRLALHLGQGQPCYARARLGRRAPRSLTADFELYNAHGVQIGAVQDVRFRSIRLHKMVDDHLDFLDFVATPRPLAHTAAPAAIDATLLRQHVARCMREAAAAGLRFSQEVDPLLESLCDRYAVDALTALAADGAADSTVLDAAVLQSLHARAPDAAALLAHVVNRAVASGHAQPLDGGWTLACADDGSTRAADIWNTLLREYPDYFPAVHAAGRIGLHLPTLLAGRMSQHEVCPPSVTPAAIGRLVCGADVMRRLTEAVVAVLSAAQAGLAGGQRLAVLEVGDDVPLFATACADVLDVDRADYGYASPNAEMAEQVQRQFAESKLNASVQTIAETTYAENVLRHDVVLVQGAFDTLKTAQQAMSYAITSLKPGGVLLWLGHHPAPWVDFLFGARAQWWCDVDGQRLSAQQSPAYWQTCLQTQGLVCDAVLDVHGQEGSGAYVLIASLPTAASACAPTVAPRGILLLANAQGASAELGSALQTCLTHLGHRCHRVLDADADHLVEVLHAARQQLGAVHDIVHLDGWGMAHAQMSAQALTQAQAYRCALAAALTQACERTETSATLWLLTTGATQPMHAAPSPPTPLPQAGEGSDEGFSAPQVGEGGGEGFSASQVGEGSDEGFSASQAGEGGDEGFSALQAGEGGDQNISSISAQVGRGQDFPSPACGRGVGGEGLSALNDAALWGYGRTLMNEASTTRVRMVDLPAHAQAHPHLMQALAREWNQPDAEDEILLDAAGARYAPRLRALARPAPPSSGAQSQAAEGGVRLGFDFPGQLRHLRWESFTVAPPADDALQVRVQATGLNFRDVMYALGLLSDEAVENGFVGPTLGLEFSGIVTHVGKDVTDYRPGDAVVGFGPASFSSHIVTPSSTVARIPQGFSFEAAATIPSTFFTVYYALHHLAHLEAGEKILIHGAAGGVGIAAIQYAQLCGAEIYATAGSAQKRDFLRLMGVQHIYDSRALAYADEILADTEGRGVDVVLNSLAGEAINRNLRVLKPFGRFLELGKRDFYENTHIGLRPFRNNISYFGIDADQLMRERPELTRRLFGELMGLFEQGLLHPLPYTAFDANDVVHAFRYMQQAHQIGKIVVTYHHRIKHVHATPPKTASRLCLPADASYLVTGGLGGFGLRTAQWLVDKGARHLILMGRSGPKDDHARAVMADFQARGVHVVAAACDVTDRNALADLLAQTAATMPPLKGIVHAAAVIADGLASKATQAQIEQNLAAKVLGARHLHELTRQLPLDFCIYYSSATTLFGNPGQSAYVAANTWLESLALLRRAEGLPATCVRWGAIDDVGFLARNEKIKQALQGRIGGAALPSAVALQALEDMLMTDASGLGVLELDWRTLGRFLPSADAPKFADVARHVDDDGYDHGGADDIAHLLATLDDEALCARVVDILKAELGEILRVPANKIDASRSVYDMGLDSLMGVELVVALENRFGIRLPVMALNESASVEKLALRLVTLLRGDACDEKEQPTDAVTATVTHIASSHAAEVSDASISAFVEEIARDDAVSQSRMIH